MYRYQGCIVKPLRYDGAGLFEGQRRAGLPRPRPSEHGKRIGLALRQVRKEQGLNQTQVAYQLGLTVDAYAKYERGETALRVESLDSFATALGVTPDDLAQRIGFGLAGGPPAIDEGSVRLDLEGEIARLAGTKKAGVALVTAARHWREIPPSARDLIMATIADALARAEERSANRAG